MARKRTNDAIALIAKVSRWSAVMPTLYRALQSFPIGTKQHQAVLNALRALTVDFAQWGRGGKR